MTTLLQPRYRIATRLDTMDPRRARDPRLARADPRLQNRSSLPSQSSTPVTDLCEAALFLTFQAILNEIYFRRCVYT